MKARVRFVERAPKWVGLNAMPIVQLAPAPIGRKVRLLSQQVCPVLSRRKSSDPLSVVIFWIVVSAPLLVRVISWVAERWPRRVAP